MDDELPEEKFARQPLVRRFSFWAAIGLAVLAVSGFTLKDALFADSPTDEVRVSPSAVTPGWGPDREMFTMQSPAPYVALNSIKDNPNYGDERNFTTVKDASISTAGGWTDRQDLAAGQQVAVRVYIENSAGDNFGDESVGWAQDVRVHVNYDGEVGYTHHLSAQITSSNAQTIWDGATVVSGDLTRLVFIPGSAELVTNAAPHGLVLGDGVVAAEGVSVGYDSLDGIVRPGYKYSAYLVLKFAVVGS